MGAQEICEIETNGDADLLEWKVLPNMSTHRLRSPARRTDQQLHHAQNDFPSPKLGFLVRVRCAISKTVDRLPRQFTAPRLVEERTSRVTSSVRGEVILTSSNRANDAGSHSAGTLTIFLRIVKACTETSAHGSSINLSNKIRSDPPSSQRTYCCNKSGVMDLRARIFKAGSSP